MSLSIKPAALLAALLLGSGASAQDWEDQAHWGTPARESSLAIPSNPPCVDGALVGTLRRTGETEIVEYHSVRSTRHRFEFTPRRTIFGPAPPAIIRFGVIGDSDTANRDNALMLVRRAADGTLESVHDDLVVRDRRGREFIPIIWGPIPGLRGGTWLPLGFEAFARKVRYEDREMRIRGHDQKLLTSVAGWRGGRRWVHSPNGRAIARRGLYLDELEAMFAAQRPDQCHRPEPNLANPAPSR